MKKFLASLLLKKCSVTFGCAALIGLVAASTVLAKTEVPFKGYWNTIHHDTFGFDPTLGPTLAVVVQGQGQSSHLGRSTCSTDDQLVSLATGEFTATYVFTAANGDTLVLEFLGQQVAFDPIAQEVDFIGSFEIVGGTGRFSGATGRGTAYGWAVFEEPLGGLTNSGPGFFAFDGVISSPGAAKK